MANSRDAELLNGVATGRQSASSADVSLPVFGHSARRIGEVTALRGPWNYAEVGKTTQAARKDSIQILMSFRCSLPGSNNTPTMCSMGLAQQVVPDMRTV